MEELKKIWKENGFPSAAKLWAILKQKGLNRKYKNKDVVEFVAGQDVNQLHRKTPTTKQAGSFIMAPSPGTMYCIDLLDMSAYGSHNGGVKWLLLVIDIFSRCADIVPVKNKTAPLVAAALEEACSWFGKWPKMMMSDQGSEFKGASEKLMKEHGVIHRVADVGDHRRLGVVDRFSGVVKGWIAKYMTYHQTKEYVDALDGMVKAYNAAPHSSLDNISPNKAWANPQLTSHIHYQRIRSVLKKKGKVGKINVGDYVRVLKLRGVFDKGYNVKYSLEKHQVEDIKGLNYILDNGKFYRKNRLQKVTPPLEEEEPEVPVARKDVAREARRSHRVATVLQTEGIQQENRRSGLRQRVPSSQLEDVRYGRLKY